MDAFQALFEETEHLDHRGNNTHARELLGDLLIDLMHYADHRSLEFNDILAQANGYYLSEQNNPDVFAIGTTVQLNGPAADEAILLGAPTRGTVTGLLVPTTARPSTTSVSSARPAAAPSSPPTWNRPRPSRPPPPAKTSSTTRSRPKKSSWRTRSGSAAPTCTAPSRGKTISATITPC